MAFEPPPEEGRVESPGCPPAAAEVACIRTRVGADPDRFDLVQILKETHDPVVAVTRRVLAALKPA